MSFLLHQSSLHLPPSPPPLHPHRSQRYQLPHSIHHHHHHQSFFLVNARSLEPPHNLLAAERFCQPSSPARAALHFTLQPTTIVQGPAARPLLILIITHFRILPGQAFISTALSTGATRLLVLYSRFNTWTFPASRSTTLHRAVTPRQIESASG